MMDRLGIPYCAGQDVDAERLADPRDRMRRPPMAPEELALLLGVLRQHPEITEVRIFGSRAKGTHSIRSDIDLAL